MQNLVKASQLPLFTLKEVPSDAQIKSHQLLLKAGYIRKQAAGLYVFLPFGQMVHRKIEQIIREQMNLFGGIEVKLPVITSAELWQTSGRWQVMGAEMMRMTDRHQNSFALGPTHEESITWLAQNFLQSYKQLPINLYQIGTKYRDEVRPRYGLIRCREFVMKDAYSFHLDEASLDETYQKMRDCYRSIFERCSLVTIPVEADSGAMGGAGSEEFMVASDIGEETLLLCEDSQGCGYQSNQEKTACLDESADHNEKMENPSAPEKRATPNTKTIEDVAAFFKLDPSSLMKTYVLENDETVVIAFLPGHREANMAKIQKHSQAANLEPASGRVIEELFHCEAGYLGPYQWQAPANIKLENKNKQVIILCDRYFRNKKGLVSGANEKDHHFININFERDLAHLAQIAVLDLINATAGDLCPQCKKARLRQTKGIEVGHIFKLGEKYTKAFQLSVLDQNGRAKQLTMGCYGIGVGRTMATVIEQSADDKGIIWPRALSPFDIYFVGLAKSPDEKLKEENLIGHLNQKGFSVYYDDRNERPGVKFNDAELVGFPLILICGKSFFQEDQIEIKIRRRDEKILLTMNQLWQNIEDLLG